MLAKLVITSGLPYKNAWLYRIGKRGLARHNPRSYDTENTRRQNRLTTRFK